MMNRRDFTRLSVLGALAAALPAPARAEGSLVVEWSLSETGEELVGRVGNASAEPVEVLGEEDGVSGSTVVIAGGEPVRVYGGRGIVSRAGPRRHWVALQPGETRTIGTYALPEAARQPAEAVITVQSRAGAVELRGPVASKPAERPSS